MNFHFLIIGPGRGGTSLLASLLDSHPDIEVGMELYAVDTLMHIPDSFSIKLKHKQMADAFYKKNKFEAHRSAKSIWGNKITTEQLQVLYHLKEEEAIRYFMNAAPGPFVFIFLMRDGRTCIPSKVKRGGKTLDEAIENWIFADKIHGFFRKHLPTQTYAFKYENLVKDPEGVLTKICKILGVKYTDEMLAGTRSEKLRPEYRHTEIIAEKAQQPEVEDWHEKIEAVLRKWEYLD